jgi:N-acetylglucosaminyl-diphospho-decaprenol L-rhamnosyltransferase
MKRIKIGIKQAWQLIQKKEKGSALSSLTMNSSFSCAVVIVTHNSQAYLPKCIESIEQQSLLPSQVIIVDSCSDDCSYLEGYFQRESYTLILAKENIGFCHGNNLAIEQLSLDTEFILFLNPDAFLFPGFFERARQLMQTPSMQRVAALSGLLLGYQIDQNKPTGLIDSTGIFRKWYGRWYDRDQRLEAASIHRFQEKVPALCGAMMFCRQNALRDVQLTPNQIMNSSFYMYKEDIDLSIRLRQKGWQLLFDPQLAAYHCRGWQQRMRISKKLRLQSAKNECRIHVRLKSPCLLYSLLKFLSVKFLNM